MKRIPLKEKQMQEANNSQILTPNEKRKTGSTGVKIIMMKEKKRDKEKKRNKCQKQTIEKKRETNARNKQLTYFNTE